MAALLTTQTDNANADYDPHEHRRIPKPTSYADTMIHLIKGSIGAGILAMPSAMSRVGVLVGIVGIAIVGIVATYCIHLLILAQYEICKRKRKGYMAYANSMRIALEDGPKCLRSMGRVAACFVDTVLVIWQVGVCCVYVVFTASNFKQIFDVHEMVYPLRWHIIFLLLPLAILNMVLDLKCLSGVSLVANVLTLFGLLLVFFYLIEDDLEFDESNLYKSVTELLDGIPIFVGTTLFAIEAVGVILAIEYNMEKPKEFLGLFGLFNCGMFVIISMYAIVGVFGYLKYGNEVAASITLNLPVHDKKAQASKGFMAVAIFLSFPLQNFVAYQILMRKVTKRVHSTKLKFTDYVVKSVTVIIPWGFALAIPTLGPFIALFGAFCLSLLGLVFPAIIDLCTYHILGYGPLRYKFFRDIIIMIVGMSCLSFGCYHAILEIFEELEEHN